MPQVRTGPVAGLIAQVALLTALALTVGLGPAGWVVGLLCGVVTSVTLAHGLVRYGADALGPANRVTLGRAALVGAVTALIADALVSTAHVALLVTLAAVALALDTVDGWVARHTGSVSPLGARFDEEVDSFLILALSVYVAATTAWWVLVIGLARYAFALAAWRLPWMRRPLPYRYWGKVVAAVQGVTLTVAAADVLPTWLMNVFLVLALVLLAESFGGSVAWLWKRRHEPLRHLDDEAGADVDEGAGPRRSPVRTAAAFVTTLLAVALVWMALVAPNKPGAFDPESFLRIPIEGLVVVAVVLVLPPVARRVVAWVVGPVLGLLLVVKVLDIGFLTTLDRPFNPVTDWAYTSSAIETMRDSFGRTGADLAVVGVVVFILAVLVLTTLAVRRVTRVAARHRDLSLRIVTALGAVWALFALLGTQVGSVAPVASRSAASLALDQVHAVRTGVADHGVFAKAIARDRFHGTPADQLLTGLRGKDVILAFVESYGKVALDDPSLAPRISAGLDASSRRLRADGFSSRSAWLTSSTYGGISWLAHSTMQSGVWVSSQRRYDQLMTTDRFTLSKAFKKAGWRTVVDVPSNNRSWLQGTSYYHYDKLYDRRNVGYQGRTFAYASMPDQYVLSAFQRLELARTDRPPLFGEIDLVSSHEPWTRIPRMIPWDKVGDGSIYKDIPVKKVDRDALWSDPDRVRAAYGRSIQYTMTSLVSFMRTYGNKNTVMIVLGDHQPWSIVSGHGASHDVPISVIAKDPKVVDAISGWSWQDGLRPDAQAPVWPMSAFRDRFLTAYGSVPATSPPRRPDPAQRRR